MAILTLHPNEVLTALPDNPSAEKRVLNVSVKAILGLSSATAIHVRKEERLIPLSYEKV